MTGIIGLVSMLLKVAISPASNGRERTAATGTRRLVVLLLIRAISLASNGRERMGVTGTRRLVSMLLLMVISPASNGRERTDVQSIEEYGSDYDGEGGWAVIAGINYAVCSVLVSPHSILWVEVIVNYFINSSLF